VISIRRLRMMAHKVCLLSGFLLIPFWATAQDAAPVRPAAADPEAAALAGFDEERGLWFPPDRPREDYLANLSSLMRPVMDIFKADPPLARAVCTLLADPKREARSTNLSQEMKQKRTMMNMVCAGILTHEQAQVTQETIRQATEAKWEAWMELKTARTLDLDGRRARVNELMAEGQLSVGGDDALQRPLAIFGLSPQADLSILDVLRAAPWGESGQKRIDAFLTRLFDRETAEGMPDAALFRMARRHFLFYRGKYQEALELSTLLVDDPALERWKGDNQIVLAILRRIAGKREPLDAITANCPVPELRREEFKAAAPGAYCRDIAYALSIRSIDTLGEKASPRLADVLEDIARAELTNWPRRLDCIRHIAVFDAGRARSHAEELLQVPASIVPEGARMDALMIVGKTSRKLKEFPRAQNAYDRYLDLYHYRPVPIPPDLWTKLAALPTSETGKRMERTLEWQFLAQGLSRKVETAIDASDFAGARRFAEQYLAATLAIVDTMAKADVQATQKLPDTLDDAEIPPETLEAYRSYFQQNALQVALAARDEARIARWHLGELAGALKKAGRIAEAKRIVAYMLTQPDRERSVPSEIMSLYSESRSTGKPIEPADRPWDATAEPSPARAKAQSRSKR
jgi:hypothetical protein